MSVTDQTANVAPVVESPAAAPAPAVESATPPVDSDMGPDGDTDTLTAKMLESMRELDADVEPAEVVDPTPEVPAEPAAKLEEDPELGPAKDKKGRENRIPYSRVKTIVANAKTKAMEEAAQAYQPKIAGYENHIQEMEAVGEVMQKNPSEFLSVLVNTVPGYRELLTHLISNAPQHHEAPDLEPYGQAQDGSPVYTAAQLRTMLDRQAQEVEARITERYRPIEERYVDEQRTAAVAPKVQAQLQEALTWPGFKENEAAILAALKQNANISLEGAYRKTVLPKLVADRNRIREDVLRELKNQPRSTHVATSTTGSRPQDDGDDLDAKMLRKMKALDGQP